VQIPEGVSRLRTRLESSRPSAADLKAAYESCTTDVAGEASRRASVNTLGAKAAVGPSANRAVKRSSSAEV
jgi:hypothetical protein